MPYAIGIDVGTTNSKVVLCDLSSCVVMDTEKFESPRTVEGEHVDYDINVLMERIVGSLRHCTKRLGASSRDVRFVSIASVGESGVLVHRDGSFDGRSIFWYDRRGETYSNAVCREGYARRMYGITGLPVHPNSALFKILWLRDNGADIGDAVWLPLADFVAWYLCGEQGQDQTLASRTAVLDMKSATVSDEILDRFSLPHTLFPAVKRSGVSRGTVLADISKVTGLPTACEVCVAGHDHMVGSMACGVMSEGSILNSTGTSEGILSLGKEPKLGDEAFDRNLSNGRYVLDGAYSFYTSVPAAGFSFQWGLSVLGMNPDDFFGRGQFDLYDRYVKCRPVDNRPIDSDVLFVPHLRGSGPPHRNPKSRGVFYGLSETTKRDDLVYSLHLGVCMEFNRLFQCMSDESIRAASNIKVIGPAVKNPLWMQMKADVLGVPVIGCDVQEAVALGAVLVAARQRGLSCELSFDSSLYEPDSHRHERLRDVYENRYVPLCDSIRVFEDRL